MSMALLIAANSNARAQHHLGPVGHVPSLSPYFGITHRHEKGQKVEQSRPLNLSQMPVHQAFKKAPWLWSVLPQLIKNRSKRSIIWPGRHFLSSRTLAQVSIRVSSTLSLWQPLPEELQISLSESYQDWDVVQVDQRKSLFANFVSADSQNRTTCWFTKGPTPTRGPILVISATKRFDDRTIWETIGQYFKLSFLSVLTLICHSGTFTQKKKPFKCTECGKGFCQSRTLAVHRILHMEDSPHKCTTCGRSFNQRSNLKTHLLTHTDIKPYNCQDCGKEFRRNCDLRRHTLTHTLGLTEAQAAEQDCNSPEHADSCDADQREEKAGEQTKDDDLDVVNWSHLERKVCCASLLLF